MEISVSLQSQHQLSISVLSQSQSITMADSFLGSADRINRKSVVPMQPRQASRRNHLPFSSLDDSAAYPVNYSGTQVNVFGQQNPENIRQILHQARHPASTAQNMNTYPYSPGYPPMGYTNNVQLGLVTEHMLRKLDESRLLTMTELMKRCYGNQAHPPGPYVQEPLTPRNEGIEYGPPRANSVSPGHGDWKGQIQHIYAHLLEIAQEDRDFRKNIGEPLFGDITSADLEETGQAYTLTLTFEKPRLKDRESAKSRRSLSAVPKVKSHRSEEQEYEKENIRQEGTLKPYKQFNPEADAEVLRKAMKGLGTDEDAISGILGRRSNKQRQEIIKTYKTMFGKDLVKDLKSELSGDYWKTVRALCIPPADYDATELRNAIKGLGTDDATVIEIICTRTNKSLKQISEAYKRLFNRSLEEDISGDTSGHYQRLLIALLQANRNESNVVDKTLAKKEAQLLHEAGAKKWGTDESRFNTILVSRSYPQLRATFQQYERIAGKSMEDAIKSEMSGDLEAGMLTIVRCVQNKAGYFAKMLYKAMKGLGTDDDALIRIVASRCEVDMVQIKEEFFRDYKQNLAQFIADDTSGDYRTILLMLIGESSAGKKATSSRVIDDEDSD